jgi:hypothetical protein
MTFDQWIDSVNAQVRAKLGNQVRTEELSWDSAMWVSAMSLAFRSPEATPDIVSTAIARRLGR